MNRWAADVARAILAIAVAALLVKTGFAHLPDTDPALFRHPAVLVYATKMLPPTVVRATPPPRRSMFARARPGEWLPVSLTQYCLTGTTRRDHKVRLGIVAADPRVFPLSRYVEILIGKHSLGRFLIDDTGGKVKGHTLDIWTPSCSDARRFGRQRGTAMLVTNPEK